MYILDLTLIWREQVTYSGLYIGITVSVTPDMLRARNHFCLNPGLTATPSLTPNHEIEFTPPPKELLATASKRNMLHRTQQRDLKKQNFEVLNVLKAVTCIEQKIYKIRRIHRYMNKYTMPLSVVLIFYANGLSCLLERSSW